MIKESTTPETHSPKATDAHKIKRCYSLMLGRYNEHSLGLECSNFLRDTCRKKDPHNHNVFKEYNID